MIEQGQQTGLISPKKPMTSTNRPNQPTTRPLSSDAGRWQTRRGVRPPHRATHIVCERPIITSMAPIVQRPMPVLQPNQLSRGLGSQIASAASGITGLIGVTDASVTTASFPSSHMSIQAAPCGACTHAPGVLRK